MEKIEIGFGGAAPADATRLAEDLVAFVKTELSGVEAETIGDAPDAMDFGAGIALLLGTPAIIALARGLADWTRRQGDPDLVITTKKGSVTVKGGLDLATKKELILAALKNGTV